MMEGSKSPVIINNHAGFPFNCASEEDKVNTDNTSQEPLNLPRLRPKNKTNRTTRRPRNASQNMQYTEEPEPIPLAKNQKGYVKNITPPAGGPSDECVRAQSKCSEQPSSSLPGLPIPEVDPYDDETEPESNVPVETSKKLLQMPVHHLQGRAQLALRATHVRRSPHHENTSVRYVVMSWTVFMS